LRTEVLIVEDNPDTVELLTEVLGRHPVALSSVGLASQCLKAVEARRPDIVLLDYRLPDGDGLDLIGRILAEYPRTQVILMTAFGSIPMAVEAVNRGALDVLSKPFDLEQLEVTLQRALRVAGLLARTRQDREELDRRFRTPGLVGQSPPFLEALRLAGEVAATDATVLITGESGTGKELFARAIHDNSPRHERAFFPINCSAIPDTLLESELFGYRRGAFTGADSDRQGILDRASGGTVFLDEIAETSPAFQAKLLRVLQDREFLPLGASQLRRCDVRVLAATNKPLARWVAEGKFREDLYFRINGFEIALPPLRERKEDLVPLAEHFLTEIARAQGRPLPALGKGVAAALREHGWPGNVRELRNKLEMASILHRGGRIEVHDLFPGLRTGEGAGKSGIAGWVLPVDGVHWEEVERHLLVQALERSRGNVTQAAKLLGLSRATLRYRLQKHDLTPSEG